MKFRSVYGRFRQPASIRVLCPGWLSFGSEPQANLEQARGIQFQSEFQDLAWLKSHQNWFEGGAAGSARARRIRKQKLENEEGALGPLLQALSGLLNGQDPMNLMQGLQKCLHQAKHQRTKKTKVRKQGAPWPPDQRNAVNPSGSHLQSWQGRKYQVDPHTGWWTWIGEQETRAHAKAWVEPPQRNTWFDHKDWPCLSPGNPASNNRQVSLHSAPADCLPNKATHKITGLRLLDWKSSPAPAFTTLGRSGMIS